MTWQEQFEARVPDRPESGCWIWTGGYSKGYGILMVGPCDPRRAYRLAYETFIGPVSPGLEVEHVCEVKACVRWTYDEAIGSFHLAAVTHAENLRRSRASFRAGSWNAKKTHCPQGHEYSEENTYRYGTRRVCKTCANTRGKKK